VRQQLGLIYACYGFRWYHHALRLTVGRCASYLGNPHRSPLGRGIVREVQELWAHRGKKT